MFFKGKSDAYKYLICIMQHVHFQVGVGVFNCEQMLTKISFVIFDIAVKKTNQMWFIVVCTLIDNDTCHHSGHNPL